MSVYSPGYQCTSLDSGIMDIGTLLTFFFLIVAILSSYAPNDVPFMADEAVEAVLGGRKVSYTMRGYMDFVEEIKKLTTKLNKDEGVCVCVCTCVRACVCV